jgi:alpha-N-arabinofuranosidase
MILTEGDKMVLTPTYHVFEMFKSYQDATALNVSVKSPWYSKDGSNVPAVGASAVRDRDGMFHVGLVNVDPNRSITVTAKIDASAVASARVLTAGATNAHNTFDHPLNVRPASFAGASVEGGALKVVLPAKSIVMVDLR